jgi:hypothetical protein
MPLLNSVSDSMFYIYICIYISMKINEEKIKNAPITI